MMSSGPAIYSRRGVIAAGGAGLLASCAGDRQTVLRSADTHPDGYPTVAAVRYMAEKLSERTDGRIRLKVFPGGQLGEEKGALEITIFGGLDFARLNMAPLNSVVPETFVPNLPFIFRSIEHMRAVMDGAPGRQILHSLRAHGLVGLCFYDSGARSFYTTDRLINTPEDLAGLKIRVQNSDLYVSMVEALGADATPMPFGEVYQGLVQGVVDGAENNFPSYESTRHFEVAKYYSLTRHVMAPEVFVMSLKSWRKLSQSDQELIQQCATESVGFMRGLWDARVEKSREQVLAAGVETVEPDLLSFRDKVRPAWDRFLNTPGMKSLADSIEAVGV